MSSSKTRNMLLILFVVLTLIFGSLSAYEFSQVQQVRSTSQNTVTSTTFSVTTISVTIYPTTYPTTTPSGTLPDNGYIQIQTIGEGRQDFAYTKLVSSTPDAFVFDGVNFTLWVQKTVTFSAGPCASPGGYHGYLITFSDGSSENLSACMLAGYTYEIFLTKHTDPQAGLMVFEDGALYFLSSG